MTMRRGGVPLPKDWPKTRKRILQRDPICSVCHRNPSEEVDHEQPSGPDTDGNLRGICKPCHQRKSSQEGGRARAAQLARAKRKTESHPGITDTKG